MSRVGKKPIPIPSGVVCTLNEGVFHVKKGSKALQCPVPDLLNIAIHSNEIVITPQEVQKSELQKANRLWGTIRSVIANMVKGVSEDFSIKLDLEGVGYRAAVSGQKLEMKLGYSHDCIYPFSSDVQVVCDKSSIRISGIDKQKIGQMAAEIRKKRPPEPYKGKGIRREGEFVLRKEGKRGR